MNRKRGGSRIHDALVRYDARFLPHGVCKLHYIPNLFPFDIESQIFPVAFVSTGKRCTAGGAVRLALVAKRNHSSLVRQILYRKLSVIISACDCICGFDMVHPHTVPDKQEDVLCLRKFYMPQLIQIINRFFCRCYG